MRNIDDGTNVTLSIIITGVEALPLHCQGVMDVRHKTVNSERHQFRKYSRASSSETEAMSDLESRDSSKYSCKLKNPNVLSLLNDSFNQNSITLLQTWLKGNIFVNVKSQSTSRKGRQGYISVWKYEYYILLDHIDNRIVINVRDVAEKSSIHHGATLRFFPYLLGSRQLHHDPHVCNKSKTCRTLASKKDD